MKENKKSLIKSLISGFIVFGITVYGLFLIGSHGITEYNLFGKIRTGKMERTFSIEVTDDIELRYYREYGCTDATSYYLKIVNINDPEKFMQNNVKKSIVNHSGTDSVSDEVEYSYKYPYESTYGTDYQKVNVTFCKEEDNTYSAHLTMLY